MRRYWAEGEAALRSGNAAGAKGLIERAARLALCDPQVSPKEKSELFVDFGLVHMALRDPVLAVQAFSRAAQVDPENLRSLTQRAQALHQLGLFDMVRPWCRSRPPLGPRTDGHGSFLQDVL